MLASIMVDYLGKTTRGDRTALAYLYCNYRKHEQQTDVDLLSTLLRQLIQGQPTIPKLVKALYEHHVDRGTRPTFSEVAKVLHSVVCDYAQVFIVIDALDECADDNGTRRALLSEIRNLQTLIDTRFMATSRLIPKITQEFAEDLTLEVRARDEDVKQYLEGQMQRLSRCVLRDSSLQELIKEEIIKTVDGM